MTSDAYRRNYTGIKWTALWRSAERMRRENVAPYVISDTMPETLHHAAGRVSTSKSEFRRWTRQAGCEEVGNEKFPERKPIALPPVREDLKRVWEAAKNR